MPNEIDYVNMAEQAWNEAAPVHWKVTQKLLEEIRDPKRLDIHQTQVDELQRLNISGKSVAHLNCNNGRETITIKRLGAGMTVGFDIASGFIEQAKELAIAAGTDCEFICSDVYRIPETFDGTFDLVVITAGALAFMPDLEAYFKVARRILRTGGTLTVYEAHPITRMFLKDRDRKDQPIKIVKSYFDSEPVRHESGLDYQGGTTYEAMPVYYFQYKMSDVINAVINAGFTISRFTEHDRDPSQARTSLESLPEKPPLSYILTAKVIEH